MKVKLPSGKKILLPGLILVVAALGLLFFLQIRWMNNSLQARNMRYRRGVIDALNHVARSVLDSLDFDTLDYHNPLVSLENWREQSDYPDLILSIIPLEDDLKERVNTFYHLKEKEVYLFGGTSDHPYLVTLDSTLFYEEILPLNLEAYSRDYSYSLVYREVKSGEIMKFRKELQNGKKDVSLITAFLPLIIENMEGEKRDDNILFNPSDLPFYGGKANPVAGEEKGAEPLYTHVLEIDLSGGKGSEEFENRLRVMNVSLLISLLLILSGMYFLLFRLYRREENQRKVEQTFVASVSHELKTPIAVIKSASENLARGIITDGERLKSYGELLEAEADRLNRMVEGILFYSRLEGSGQIDLMPQWLDPRSLTGELLERIRMTFDTDKLQADLAGAPEKVFLDRESYGQILENLLSNALLHSGGAPIRVRLETDFPDYWRLIVEDEGPGIPRREQKNIFDPFVRGNLSVEKQVRGSGLGLFLVKQASRLLEGEIKLESPYQLPAGHEIQGSRFTLILPIHKEVAGDSGSDD